MKRLFPALFLLASGLGAEETIAPLTQRKAANKTMAGLLDVSRFSAHKANFFLPYTHENKKREGRNHNEAKFQLSMKYHLYRPFYFAYTQKTLWQLYDASDSRPVRETNYNPELFWQWVPREWPLLPEAVRFGVEHESNGGAKGVSRSWDRAYAWLHFQQETFSFNLKAWSILSQRSKVGEGDALDPQIQKYYGWLETSLAFSADETFVLGGLVRYNPSNGHGAFRLDLLADTGTIRLYAQYWRGYGESLIDYDQDLEKFGAGLAFTWGAF